MIVSFSFNNKHYQADLLDGVDISIPLKSGAANPNCYYAEAPSFEVIRAGSFIGSVKEGGVVNHRKITFTPHGNGTHTECYGHIAADETTTLNTRLKNSHALATVISLTPVVLPNGDRLLTLNSYKEKVKHEDVSAIIIRSLPNEVTKQTRQYSGTNPPFMEAALAAYLAEKGVEHLLLDLPSVDKEVDGGRLASHKAFWKAGDESRKHCTITEMVFVPNHIQDGLYFLNLQIAPFENDASPSRPVLYKVREFLP
jgi:arylformamidase